MTSTLNGLLAAELRAEKARQQISGRELARRVGKPETTVARYLRGGTAMSLDDIEDFARALDMTTVDLISRAYDSPRPTPPDTDPGDTRATKSRYSRRWGAARGILTACPPPVHRVPVGATAA